MYRVSKKVLFEIMHEHKMVRLYLNPNNIFNNTLRFVGEPIEFLDGEIISVSVTPNVNSFTFAPLYSKDSQAVFGSQYIHFDFKDIKGIEYLE